MRYGLMLVALVLSGCAGSQFRGGGLPPLEGYTVTGGDCLYLWAPGGGSAVCTSQHYVKQVGPSSQGSFTEPRH